MILACELQNTLVGLLAVRYDKMRMLQILALHLSAGSGP